MPERDTEQLRLEQARREREEAAGARDAEQGADQRAHERRAERAGYLKEKLDERMVAEERVDDDS